MGVVSGLTRVALISIHTSFANENCPFTGGVYYRSNYLEDIFKYIGNWENLANNPNL